MAMDESVRKAILGAVPSLRAFAISLCGNVDRADDLVQETLLRALANINSFQPGTNMSAWLFTILRNHFRSEYRKRRREVEDSDGHYAETLKTQPEQYGQVEFREFREALAQLPQDQREALDTRRRLRLLLRGGGQHLRLRGGHDQIARQPRAHAPRRTHARQQRGRLRPRRAGARSAGGGRIKFTQGERQKTRASARVFLFR